MFYHQQSIGAVLAGATQSPGDISSPTFLSSEPAPYVTGARAPSGRTVDGKRKQVLLALIDELAALRDEELEKEREISYNTTKDERMSADSEGIEKFQAFDANIRALDLKLEDFSNAIRHLGFIGGLLPAAGYLRTHLRQIQYFFRENAAELFDGIPHAPNDGTRLYGTRKRGEEHKGMVKGPGNTKRWSIEIEDLPDELENMAKDLGVFLRRLNDFPGFTYEAANISITAFEGDLRYRASCLREFEGQLKFVAVARYINDITEDLGAHMLSMVDSLNTFITVGIPLARLSLEDIKVGLQSLSAVAAFVSGVTATTLQVHALCFNAN